MKASGPGEDHLSEQLMAVEEELRQREQELSSLYNLAVAIGRDPSTSSILHNALAELTRVLRVPFGCVYVKSGTTFRLRSCRGFSAEETKRLAELDLPESDQLGDADIIQELFQEESGQIPAWQKTRGIQSWVSVPVRTRGNVIGLIRLASLNVDHFTSASLSLITSVATQIAMALTNAWLYEQAKASEEKYRSIFENMVVGLYQSSREGKILTANAALVHLLGCKTVKELLAADIPRDFYISPEEREKNLEILHRTGQLTGVELQLRRKDGREITALEYARAVRDTRGQLLYYEGTLIDITEKKSLEQQLLQAQKMQSIGTLVGGIAHDFNNMLTGIWGYTQLLLNQVEPSGIVYDNLRQIELISERASDMVGQLLAFSRKDMGREAPVSLHPFLKEIGKLLERMMPEDIEIELDLAPVNFIVEANPTQLQQVIMNLAVNARDAMPQGGRLRIGTTVKTLDEAFYRTHPGLLPRSYVCLSVSDTGVGIPPEVQPRIFDPFFTTKEIGKGTGLGLSVVYGIVKNHDGAIEVASQVGSGTTIHIYWPLAETTAESVESSPVRSTGGTETILLVEDDSMVLQLAQAALEYYGYRVLTARDGLEGLDVYRQNQSEIALVILDVGMPRMGGRDTFKELKQMNPTVKVLLATGYNPGETVEEMIKEGARGLVRKPYQVHTLAEAVRAALLPS